MEFKPNILVVDDEQPLLRLIGGLLSDMGAEPCLVTDSVHAAELINRDKFDGAIVDWRMPEMDGLELTRQIRRSHSNKKIPVVMLTEVQDADAMQQAFKAGANFFLQKPVSVAQLRHLLNATRGAMLEERRNYQRAPVALAVRVQWDSRQERATSVNLSASGALLSMVEPPEEGTEVSLELALPKSAERITASGRVTRVAEGPAPGESSGRGVGVEFTSVQPRHRRQLAQFVEKTLATLSASEF